MASPSKNLLAPTGLSLRPIAYIKVLSTSIVKCGIGPIYLPVLFNQLNARFMPVLTTVNIPRTFIKLNTSSKFVNRASNMIANTFPAGYTAQTTSRPTFGQLWPVSGSMPY